MNDRSKVTPGLTAGGYPSSQQRAWWPVHEFLQAVLQQANCGPIPPAGTPAWADLGDGDPRKLLALAVAGEHHVLRIETNQMAMAEASRAVAAVPDWRTRPRGVAYIPRKAS